MTKIEPKYVTFEQSKWLKEKGFDVPCQFLYVDGKYRIDFEKEGDLFNNRYPSTQIPIDWCLAPEQHQVVEWLRVNHGIWVFVAREPETGVYYPNIDVNKGDKYFDKFDDYDSPQEAYSAAFDYILNNKFGIILK